MNKLMRELHLCKAYDAPGMSLCGLEECEEIRDRPMFGSHLGSDWCQERGREQISYTFMGYDLENMC